MNGRRTLLFALLAAALGAYIYFVEAPKITGEAVEEFLLSYDPARVGSLGLQYPGESPISIVREDSGWRLAEPIQTGADSATVDRLVEQIAQIKVERRLEHDQAQPLETYGLEGDGERARVTVGLKDGTTLPAIVVGTTTPVGYSAFVRKDGSDDIVVTPLIFHTGIKKTVLELRDKRLFPLDQGSIVSLRIQTPTTQLQLERKADEWRLVTPFQDRADPGQIETLIASITSMTALDYYDGAAADKAAFGLLTPAFTVTLAAADGTETAFRVGNRVEVGPPGYYLERLADGQAVKAPDWLTTRFPTDPAAYRDKHLFFCDPTEITKISFERASSDSFALSEVEGENWQIDPPPDAEHEIRRDLVTRRRGGLVSLAGAAIVADHVDTAQARAQYGLDAPEVTVELTLRDGSSCGRAAGGVVKTDSAEAELQYFVMRLEDDVVMSVPQYQYSRLNALREDFLVAREQPEASQDPAP